MAIDSIRALLPARLIPEGSTVTKRAGEKEYKELCDWVAYALGAGYGQSSCWYWLGYGIHWDRTLAAYDARVAAGR